ncbi:stage II sporulation protein M [Candidatus Woesearchaeota archaeon]|nr:stage II sporulation protein M [Candidatus Woesearchaeota archaeon]
MVLESILDPKAAEDKPIILSVVGFLYTSIAFLIGSFIFTGETSIICVFLIVFAAVPLFYKTMLYEENKDEKHLPEIKLLKEHFKAFKFFIAFFIGVALSYAFFYIALPQQYLIQLFTSQMDTIQSINGNLVAINIAMQHFNSILFNNIKVLALCILFAFIYGSGAIFILTWNASVVGVAIGAMMREILVKIGGPFGYFQAISLGLLRYLIHGIPEILAYFVAGLAGSLISYASVRYNFKTKKYHFVLYDASILILISIALLFLAAFLEVFVTGNLFY